MKTLKVILTVGIPGSGKSTWAKDLVKNGVGLWIRVNKDDIRAMVHAGGKHSKEREKLTVEIRDRIIVAGLTAGKNVIVDDTNLSKSHFNHIKLLCAVDASFETGDKIEVEEKWFDDSLNFGLCMQRNNNRDAVVPVDVMENMYRNFMKRHVEERL